MQSLTASEKLNDGSHTFAPAHVACLGTQCNAHSVCGHSLCAMLTPALALSFTRETLAA
jgi:hypothetical protein